MEELIKQIYEKQFKPITFTIYNFIDSDGFVTELHAVYKEDFSIDDFEYIKLDISDFDKESLLQKDRFVLAKYNKLKKHIERELQEGYPKMKLFLMNDKTTLVIVKVKGYDLNPR